MVCAAGIWPLLYGGPPSSTTIARFCGLVTRTVTSIRAESLAESKDTVEGATSASICSNDASTVVGPRPQAAEVNTLSVSATTCPGYKDICIEDLPLHTLFARLTRRSQPSGAAASALAESV